MLAHDQPKKLISRESDAPIIFFFTALKTQAARGSRAQQSEQH